MMHCTAAQSLPLLDYRPNALSECNDTVSSSENPSLHRFSEPVRQAAFAPVSGVDILLSHQPAQVEDHLDTETTFQPERNRGGNVTTRVNHLDPVASHEGGGFAV